MLARSLGRSLRELLATVDAGELALWEAEYALEPWGDVRLDVGFARVACVTGAVWGGKASMADHMPKWEPDRPQSTEELIEAGRRMARRFGGR